MLSGARLDRAGSKLHAAKLHVTKRTMKVAAEDGEYREICDRKVTFPLRRASPYQSVVESVEGRTG